MDAEERALAGRDDDDDSQKSDSDLGPEDDAEKETYPCVVAVKYPLFESTFDLPALYMRIEAGLIKRWHVTAWPSGWSSCLFN